MSFFLVRIELHHAKWPDDYDPLHTAMRVEGFTTAVTYGGKSLHLPTAEYAINSEQTTAQILEKSKKAASTTKKSFCAVVVKATEFDQYNLTDKATA